MTAAGPNDSSLPPRKRQLGIYYTADRIADVLVRWALNKRVGAVLDPSFGGCSFLRTALDMLRERKADEPTQLIHGVDLDPAAQIHAAQLIASGVPPENLHAGDFLSIPPGSIGPFSAVVGNPPYVRHHWLDDSMRLRGQDLSRRAGVPIPGRASAWAYFVVHAIQFIQPGGRLAFILPGAFIHADYAHPVLLALEQSFTRVFVIRLAERLFPDADEETVIVLGDERRANGRTRARFADLHAFEELQRYLSESPAGRVGGNNGSLVDGLTLLKNPVAGIWRELESTGVIRPLGETARVSIGVVTGCNQFFVRTNKDARELHRADGVSFVPVVPRSGWFHSVRWTKEDQEHVQTAGLPTQLLVLDRRARSNRTVRQLLESAEAQGIHERNKCSARRPWYRLSDVAAPEAFLPYMSARSPRLILNAAGATCTNAIHRVRWARAWVDPDSVIVGSWTSVFALSAELCGRNYGGGVLKLEPGKAVRLMVPDVHKGSGLLEELDRVRRSQGPTAARLAADELILRDALGLTTKDIGRIRGALSALQQRRIPA